MTLLLLGLCLLGPAVLYVLAGIGPGIPLRELLLGLAAACWALVSVLGLVARCNRRGRE